MTYNDSDSAHPYYGLTQLVKNWGLELGFEQVGISGVELGDDEQHLRQWLANKYHGSMGYMSDHGTKRSRPAELWPGTARVISVRLNYTDQHAHRAQSQLSAPANAYVSRYALGRDYHKVMRKRLKHLAQKITQHCNQQQLTITSSDAQGEAFIQRAFVDSAPVLEKALARNAGLGWIGKHSNLINKDNGSWFFLGELFTNVPLIKDKPASNHCGSCTTCIEVCPTQAIVAPYQVDARRCISYLTIESKAAIPLQYRKAMGNRIYGCDDCQLFCPWNKFAQTPIDEAFKPRHRLDNKSLIELFAWTEQEFDERTRGSAIRRTGYIGWLRNIAVALGNAPTNEATVKALTQRQKHKSAIVREHVAWALEQHALLPNAHTTTHNGNL